MAIVKLVKIGVKIISIRTNTKGRNRTFKKIQMLDVHLPTTDGRQLVLTRYTQPEKEHKMLLSQMKLNLPKQSLKIASNGEAIMK